MRTWTPADVNAASLAGTTALICAAMFGHLDIIKYLAAERGADRYLERLRILLLIMMILLALRQNTYFLNIQIG